MSESADDSEPENPFVLRLRTLVAEERRALAEYMEMSRANGADSIASTPSGLENKENETELSDIEIARLTTAIDRATRKLIWKKVVFQREVLAYAHDTNALRSKMILKYNAMMQKSCKKNAELLLPPPQQSLPCLDLLHSYVRGFFLEGLTVASQLYIRMGMAVAYEKTTIAKLPVDSTLKSIKKSDWNSTRRLCSLVLALAAPQDHIYDVFKTCSPMLGEGLPTMEEMAYVPSQSLMAEFVHAQENARMKSPKISKVTLLGVNLVDVGNTKVRLVADSEFADSRLSFSHNFVMGIGPEGVVIWQTGGAHGYSFGQYLEQRGDQLRSWEEATQFVKDFENFAVVNVSVSCLILLSDSLISLRGAGTQNALNGIKGALGWTSRNWGRD